MNILGFPTVFRIEHLSHFFHHKYLIMVQNVSEPQIFLILLLHHVVFISFLFGHAVFYTSS
jgi:hypothetical protein